MRGPKRFRRNILNAFRQVLAVYSDAKFEQVDGGLQPAYLDLSKLPQPDDSELLDLDEGRSCQRIFGKRRTRKRILRASPGDRYTKPP